MYYKWNKPTDNENYTYDKVSWIKYVPELDWYIASSIYIDELEKSSNDVRNFTLSLAFLFLLLSILYSFIFFKNLLTPVSVLSKLALNVSSGDYTTRYTNKYRDDEIGVLASKFNEMVNTIEYKTRDLEESNDELEQTITNLKLTQKKLVETERLASLGELVAGVAHEINTPVGIGLTGITHFQEITKKIKDAYEINNMTQDEFENYLNTSVEVANLVNTNLERIAQLIRNFKEIAVDQNNEEKRKFNFKKYLNEIILSLNKYY